MLNKEEKKYIRKTLFKKLKYLRYMIYAMIIICLSFVGLPLFIRNLYAGDILNAIGNVLGSVLGPIIIFGGLYLLIEFISGNQIFKFITGNYKIFRETLYAKYRETSTVRDTFMASNMNVTRSTYINYCDTQNHTKVQFIDDESYRNAEIGCSTIVVQFGSNMNNSVAFVLKNKTY